MNGSEQLLTPEELARLLAEPAPEPPPGAGTVALDGGSSAPHSAPADAFGFGDAAALGLDLSGSYFAARPSSAPPPMRSAPSYISSGSGAALPPMPGGYGVRDGASERGPAPAGADPALPSALARDPARMPDDGATRLLPDQTGPLLDVDVAAALLAPPPPPPPNLITSTTAETRHGELAAQVVPCDLTRQDRVVRGPLTALEGVSERFARHLRSTFSAALRSTVDLGEESLRLMKFGEFLHYLPSPSCLNLVEQRPLSGVSLVVLEPQLVFDLLEARFGGAGGGAGHRRFSLAGGGRAGRDFTSVELRVVRAVVDMVLRDLARAWKPIVEVLPRFVATEQSGRNVAGIAASDVVASATYASASASLSGRLHLVIPLVALQPLYSTLGRDSGAAPSPVASSLSRALVDTVQNTEVELTAALGSLDMALSEVLSMREGDFLALPPGAAIVSVEGAPKFTAVAGVRDGRTRTVTLVSPVQSNTATHEVMHAAAV